MNHVPNAYANQYEMIMSAEAQLAREVAIGVAIQRPLPLLLNIIPGMFFMEFLRRTRNTRKYTTHFLFHRKLAFWAAQALMRKVDDDEISARIETEIGKWLTRLKLSSPKLTEAYRAAVDLIKDHYLKLLQVAGDNYYDLIHRACPTKNEYENYITALTDAEKRIGRDIVALAGSPPAMVEKQKLEAAQVEKRYHKILEEIY